MGAKHSLLIIDDDFSQKALIQRLFKDLGLSHDCYQVVDGDRAIQFLERRPPYEYARRPDLILLDLELPGKHGREVLREIKTNPTLRSIPVLILSSSQRNEDIAACYEQHANAYIRKATDLKGALQVVSAIDQFWLQTAELMKAD